MTQNNKNQLFHLEKLFLRWKEFKIEIETKWIFLYATKYEMTYI